MGMLEPWHIIVILIVMCAPFGVICTLIGAKRDIGATAGFFLGFFLGIIGLIVVLCSNKKDQLFPFVSVPEQLKKYKELLDSGAITEAEYNLQKARLLNQK